MRANFEFIDKLGVDFWCFHDRDIAPDGKTLEVSNLHVCLCPLNVRLSGLEVENVGERDMKCRKIKRMW